MRVLGIDVGLKRTGLALSDETGTAVRLLPNLHANSRQVAIEKIVNLIKDFNVEAVVIGKPDANTTGSIAIARRADGLKDALVDVMRERGLVVQIHVWDEDHTSRRAMASLVDAGVRQKKRKDLLDAASAAMIVEDFLQAQLKKTDAS
jgi:putative Holliday junction resolvase